MVGLFLREQVKVTMTSHLYTFGGELCDHVSGGPIGPQLRAIAVTIDLVILVYTNKQLLVRQRLPHPTFYAETELVENSVGQEKSLLASP